MNNDLPILRAREPDSHKGNFGHVLVVGGSCGMAGAAALAGKAAQRSGAGLVTIACPIEVQAIIASMEPSYMTLGWPPESAIASSLLLDLAQRCQCVAIGPGLGRSDAIHQLVMNLVECVQTPIIIDADALVVLAENPQHVLTREQATILTPHPGEFRRLVGDPRLDGFACRQLASPWARDHRVILVLKGHQTLVTDGMQSWTNTTGNPGMATGGTGDVLTGVIAGLVGQGLTPWDAARLGVHVHGLAGDLAVQDLGEVSLIASDVPRYLPQAFRQLHAVRDPSC